MKHQISLVGGQLLPIYIGIKEFALDMIHFVVSNESAGSLNTLKPMITNLDHKQYKCNAFDFFEIKSVCEQIIEKLQPIDEITFNLTGGTKIMVLACQAIIHEKKLTGFYVNQDDTYIELPSYERKPIIYTLSIKEFFDLSGHQSYHFKTIDDYTDNDVKIAHKIESFASNDYRYKLIIGAFRKKYFNNNIMLPTHGVEIVKNNIKVSWDLTSVKIESNNKVILVLNSKLSTELLFKAVWWELLVAQEIINSKKFNEVLLSFDLQFKTDKLVSKNEIDILINTGKKLIFIECKSGMVKQEDINKMKIVKQTYGGAIAKSLLVCRELPSQSIIEKCKELDIDLFYTLAFNKEVNSLNKLSKVILELERKSSVQ